MAIHCPKCNSTLYWLDYPLSRRRNIYRCGRCLWYWIRQGAVIDGCRGQKGEAMEPIKLWAEVTPKGRLVWIAQPYMHRADIRDDVIRARGNSVVRVEIRELPREVSR